MLPRVIIKNISSYWTSVQNYKDTCRALIAKKYLQVFDRYTVTAASAVEKQANKLVGKIGKKDKKEIYSKFKDKQGRQQVVADYFLGNVDLIKKTELLKVAKKIPKGAYLYCYFNSCLYLEFLLQHTRG
jgi:adenosine deaminase CECR1